MALTTKQADWQLMCMIGAYDLYFYRASKLSPGAELTWINGELARIQAAITPIPASDFNAIKTAFTLNVASGSTFTAFHFWWESLLIKQTSFGGTSFGKWITTNASSIAWVDPTPPTQVECDLSLYTVLFFADMENLFVGAISYPDAYWKARTTVQSMIEASCDMIVSYYRNLSVPTFPTVFTYLQNALSLLSQGPYNATYNPSYFSFFSVYFFQHKTITQSPAVSCSEHIAQFLYFAGQSPGTPPSPCLSDFGSYLDAASKICGSLWKVYNGDQGNLGANSMMNGTRKTADLSGFLTNLTTNAVSPLGAIFNGTPGHPSNPDYNPVTNPYVGFYLSSAWGLDTTGQWKNIADLSQWGFNVTLQLNPSGASSVAIGLGITLAQHLAVNFTFQLCKCCNCGWNFHPYWQCADDTIGLASGTPWYGALTAFQARGDAFETTDRNNYVSDVGNPQTFTLGTNTYTVTGDIAGCSTSCPFLSVGNSSACPMMLTVTGPSLTDFSPWSSVVGVANNAGYNGIVYFFNLYTNTTSPSLASRRCAA